MKQFKNKRLLEKNEEDRELRHYEQNRNRENQTDEDNNLVRFFKLATGDKIS